MSTRSIEINAMGKKISKMGDSTFWVEGRGSVLNKVARDGHI